MDDLFEEMDCRSKTDSIVMTLLRSAMDKAHEDVQSQNGPIEFLHKRSKFYELAGILVDCGLSIVQDQEADILESSREKMLSDLTEIKGWLQRRTGEMQLLIMAKDKELVEREENELKLRHALDLNEREKVYLQEKLEFERINCQEDESHGSGDICELKNSVDQQVLNIKQKLNEERVSLTRRRRASISCSSHNELYFQLLENNRHSGSELMERVDLDLTNHFSGISSLKPNAKQMSSEIDILKGTLDLAFGKMQNAEVFPLEKQWRWSIERDMLLVSLHGFIADTKERFRKKWNMFIKETRILHDELQHLHNQIMIEEKQYDKQHMSLSTPPQPLALQRTTSEPSLADILSKLDQRKDPDPSGSNYVAKLVKNHEVFIRKQHERKDPALITLEIPRKKGSSSSSVKKGNQDPDELVSRITKSIQVMDRLIRWDDNLGSDENSFCDTKDTKNMSEDIRKLRQERDDLELQSSVMQEVFALVFRGSMESLLVELSKSEDQEEEALSSIREEEHKVYYVEKTKEWKMEMECKAFDCLLEEEVYRIVLNESINGIDELIRCCIEMEIESSETLVSNPPCRSDTVGSILKEDIHAVYLREMLHEWRTEEDDLGIEIVIREGIYTLSLREMLRECKAETGDPDIVRLVREDIYALFMTEMMKEYVDSSVEPSGNSERMKYDGDLHDPSPSELDRTDDDVDEEHKLEMTVKDLETDDHCARMYHIENESKRQCAWVSQYLMEFLQDFVEFEYMVHKRLESNSLRVDKLKYQMNGLARTASKLRRKKSLYKKAFRIRCQNLSLAENEVDLLGDQVEKLMCLLQNIYLVLHQNSAVLSQYFGVFDVLSGIQKELAKGAAFKA